MKIEEIIKQHIQGKTATVGGEPVLNLKTAKEIIKSVARAKCEEQIDKCANDVTEYMETKASLHDYYVQQIKGEIKTTKNVCDE